MPTDLLQKAKSYRWVIFAVLALGYILVYFHRLCPAVLAVDMMRDLHTTGALTGLLGAAYFYPYALMQLPAGLLSDYWGARKTITLFFFVAFAGSVLLGVAPSVTTAIIGRTLVGLGVAMLFVPTLKILAEWFHVREFAVMTGILMALGGVGSLIAAAPLAWLSARLGWRFSFVAVGIFTLILAVLVFLLVRNRPADMGWPSPAGNRSSGLAPIKLSAAVGRVLANPAFWPLAVWFFFDCAIFFSFGGLWGGPFLIQVYGLDKRQAAQILSMLAVGMIVGSPLLSYVSNSVFRARKPVLVISSVIVVGLTAVLAFKTRQIPVAGLFALCFGLGVFASAIVVIGFTTNKELFPVQMAGTATGIVNLFPFAGGAIFQPVLGAVLEHHGRIDDKFTPAGYEKAFLILFICALVAMGATYFMRETLVRDQE
ncbi:MAG: MFS transporter [Desulfobacterales bacterium]